MRRARTRRLELEGLEARQLLANGSGVFAVVEGSIDDPSTSHLVSVTLPKELLNLRDRRAVLNFELDPGGSGAVGLARIQGTRTKGTLPPTQQQVSPSRIVAGVSPGTLQVPLVAGAGADQPYRLTISLAGDLDGDYDVDRLDLRNLRSLRGGRVGNEGIPAGADLDGDGRITLRDVRRLQSNLGVSTTARPIDLSIDIPSDDDPERDRLLFKSPVTVEGQTLPGATVRLDAQSDGSFDTSVTADVTGHYQFLVTLAEGANRIRVEASDRIGQRVARSLDVTKVVPLAISARLDASSDPDGDNVVQTSSVLVTGDTTPGATVRIDAQDDGAFERSRVADATGHYQFLVTLTEGANRIRVEASDRIGQRVARSLDVTKVVPLAISARLDASSDPDGDNVVHSPAVLVTGYTVPGAEVRLDASGDGGGNQSTAASTDTGQFFFFVPLWRLGLNRMTVEAVDASGRRAGTPLVVRLLTAQGGGDTATPVNVGGTGWIVEGTGQDLKDYRPDVSGLDPFYQIPSTDPKLPGNSDPAPALPNVAAGFSQPIQTNDWWSSLLYRFQGLPGSEDQKIGNFNTPLYNHPFIVQLPPNNVDTRTGLSVAYPFSVSYASGEATAKNQFDYLSFDYPDKAPHQDHSSFEVTLDNVPYRVKNNKVVSYSDWAVTTSWTDDAGTDGLQVTLAQGSPYLFFHRMGSADNKVDLKMIQTVDAGADHRVQIFKDMGDGAALLGVKTLLDSQGNGEMVYYGLFGLKGTEWDAETDGNGADGNPLVVSVTSALEGGDYFSIALLPPSFDPASTDAALNQEMFDLFRKHAYAEIDSAVDPATGRGGTTVDYQYDPSTGQVTTTYGVKTVLRRTDGDFSAEPLMALYRHQWLDLSSQSQGLLVDPLIAGTSADDYQNTLPSKNPHGYGTPPSDDAPQGGYFAKGTMKLLIGDETGQQSGYHGFQTVLVHQGGLLPFLPPSSHLQETLAGDTFDLAASIQGFALEIPYVSPGLNPETNPNQGDGDTYSSGKQMLRAANMLAIADQLIAQVPSDKVQAMTDARDSLLAALEQALARWFVAGNPQFNEAGQKNQFLYYNTDWDSLIGYKASAGFGTGSELNDAHFHFGYFLHAAAIVSIYDPSFASNEAFGGILQALARTVNNWDRTTPSDQAVYPFLRYFAPYTGHSYASGHGTFGNGNNQESSSEAMNFNAGLALLGEVFMANPETADVGRKMRDLGIALYETEARDIEQYWFDADKAVFPAGWKDKTDGTKTFDIVAAAQNWDSGSHNDIFFNANYAEAHLAINWLPTTASSLYLARDPSIVQRNWNSWVETTEWYKANGSDPLYKAFKYPGTDWSYQALVDPSGALQNFMQTVPRTTDEFNTGRLYNGANYVYDNAGERPELTFRLITTMDEFGTLDTGVTATGLSSYAAFDKGGTRTYVAYNYSTADQDVVFTDLSLPAGSRQVTVHVPARTLAYQTGTDPSGLKTHTIANLANGASAQKNVFYLTADGTTPGATNVFPTENGATTQLTLKAGDGTQNGPPSDGSELSFIIDGLSGTMRTNLQPNTTTLFDLWLNPGFLTSAANPAVSVQFEYDFGDGNFSRKEFFQPSGLTSKLTAFEQWLRYDENVGTVSAQGDWKDFEAGKGRIRVTVWVSIGTQDIRLSTSTIASLFRQSRFEIPFDGVSAGG